MLRLNFARGETSAVSVFSTCDSWNCSSIARCRSVMVAFRNFGECGSSNTPWTYASRVCVSCAMRGRSSVSSRISTDVKATLRKEGIADVSAGADVAVQSLASEASSKLCCLGFQPPGTFVTWGSSWSPGVGKTPRLTAYP
jgi:hypothetical protein